MRSCTYLEIFVVVYWPCRQGPAHTHYMHVFGTLVSGRLLTLINNHVNALFSIDKFGRFPVRVLVFSRYHARRSSIHPSLHTVCHQSAPKNLNTSITITLQLNKFKPNTIRWQHLFCLRFRPIPQGTSYDCSTQGGLKFNADKSSMLKYFIHKRPLSIFFSLHGNFVNRKT